MSRILSGSLSKKEARDVAVTMGGEGGQGGGSKPDHYDDDDDDDDDVDDNDDDVGLSSLWGRCLQRPTLSLE